MEKNKIQAAAVIIFGALLAVPVLTGGNAEQGELGRLQEAMRNLKRVDNLQMTYEYSVTQRGSTTAEQADIWADMLTGCWVSEYYITDEDGTRPYMKQFCDARNVYVYDEWTGEWELAQGVTSSAVPNLGTVTALDYRAEDILETETGEEAGQQRITYRFTPAYLQEQRNERVAKVEATYVSYQKSGASQETLDTMEITLEQYKQMRYEDVVVTYTIDADRVLQGMEYSAKLIMPEIVTDEKGESVLGAEQETQLLLRVNIERYNQDGIINKAEQCKNEINPGMQ